MSGRPRTPAQLIAAGHALVADDPIATSRLQAIAARLAEPLRVAIAGRVKTGKSTLLNALLGEEIAPTDTGECTRIVTWYRYGQVPSVRLVPLDGPPIDRPVRLVDRRLDLDLAGRAPADIARIEVTWPAPLLADMTLIDTPGLASLSTEVSARSEQALIPDDDGIAEVDAILYLMRHLHAEDAEFLTEFIDRHDLSYTPATTIVLLGRADEVGGGRIDTMIAAERVASRYRDDPAVRRMCLDVIPVAGLLAQGAATLRQKEFDALAHLASLDREAREALLVSTDHFASASLGPSTPAPPELRASLVRRLGVFGIRLATALIRGGVDAATPLSEALLRHSNVHHVTTTTTAYLASRSEALRARNALLALHLLLDDYPTDAARDLQAAVTTALRGATEPEELLALVTLRGQPPHSLTRAQITEAERLLGGSGTHPWRRLGVARSSPADTLDRVAIEAIRDWRGVQADPAQTSAAATVAGTVIRTLEALLASMREGQESPVQVGADGTTSSPTAP
ncbi:MAG: dynamin family protein [Dermatophilaceae bacterium]